jgi:hypothetical protein
MLYEWLRVLTGNKYYDPPVFLAALLFSIFYEFTGNLLASALCVGVLTIRLVLIFINDVPQKHQTEKSGRSRLFSKPLKPEFLAKDTNLRSGVHSNAMSASIEPTHPKADYEELQKKLSVKTKHRNAARDIAVFSLGALYAFIAVVCVMEAYLQMGKVFILFVFLCIWLTDSMAFLLGYLFGKHKLAPQISPSKTWEGFLGGTIAAVGILSPILLFYGRCNARTIFLVFVVSLASHAGDLVESAAKRYFGVKDTGDIIPGHGGMIDRFDSLLMVGIVLPLVRFLIA